MDKSKKRMRYLIIACLMLIVFGIIYYFSLINYILPYTFLEAKGAVVSICIYTIGWNTRKYSKNNFMTILAVGYLIVGIFTIFHLLTYKGMGVLSVSDRNIPTQFWICARYVESFTLLLAVVCLKKSNKINEKVLIGLYLFFCLFTMFIIFTGIFPDCYMEETGRTHFKIVSEYIICCLFLLSGYYLWILRKQFETDIFQAILLSIVLKILSELFFTFYTEKYGFMNLLGHYFMIISVVMVYISLVKGNLTSPYNSLSKNISDNTAKIAQKNKELNIKDKAIASSLNAIVFIDINGCITYVNESFLSLLGYGVEEVMGCPIMNFLEKSDHLARGVERLRADGRWRGEMKLIKKDESRIHVLLTSNFIYSCRGELICGMASFIDITEQKSIEAELIKAKNDAEAANMAKSYFLANMSHEIRTPVNGILGFLQLLENTASDNKQLEYINHIKTSTDSLLTLVNDILDVSKIEAGKMEVESISYDLYSVIEKTVAAFMANAVKKGLELILKIREDVPQYVIGDPTRLRQVISNLIGNAIKFTPSGYVSLEVMIKSVNDSYFIIWFLVEDTGIGISQKVISKLFEPFTQADTSSSRKYGGTGLGLSLCKSFVSMMGGEIQVESTEGKGSKFTFTISVQEDTKKVLFLTAENSCNANGKYIPEALQDSREKQRMDDFFSTGERVQKIKCQPIKVLLAEDNEINRLFFIEFLKMNGMDCDIALDGEEAVKACLCKHYDLIFMDCQMPKMDGYEATRRIREAEEHKNHAVIIAITANAMKSDAEKCLASGMDDFISKPVDSQKINEIIKKYLNRFGKTDTDS